MSVSPAQNCLKPSPVPGPLILYLKSGLLAASASAIAVEIGSTVDEPETLIEPEMAAGAEPLAAGADAAVVGVAALDAVVGAALEPELEHAANANAAAKAKAVRRFGVEVVTRGSSCRARAAWRAGGLGAARLGAR